MNKNKSLQKFIRDNYLIINYRGLYDCKYKNEICVDIDKYPGIIENGRLTINFGRINGSFVCNDSCLTTLEGSPKYVGGGFYCNNNILSSLEGSPKYVGKSFWCANSTLLNLKGSPKYVGGSFSFCNNNVLNLNDCPEFVGNNFICYNNRVIFTEKYVRSICNVIRNVHCKERISGHHDYDDDILKQ